MRATPENKKKSTHHGDSDGGAQNNMRIYSQTFVSVVCGSEQRD
jgi:hypothetical protein